MAFVGAISPPGDKWVRDESITMMQWAKEFGAAAFQLEHRFYGPKENSPTEYCRKFVSATSLSFPHTTY